MSNIKKIKIKNFKCFNEFELGLKPGINIIVGQNEAGKTTLLEAMHLALTGLLNGKYIKNELTQYIFNNEAIKEYLDSLNSEEVKQLPNILIEIYLEDESIPELMGSWNSERSKSCGLRFIVEFDESYKEDYEQFVKYPQNVKSLPIEYYTITWKSFADKNLTSRIIQIKSALIDSSSNRFQNGSDVYISYIIKNFLNEEQKINVSQAHRKMKENFSEERAIKEINATISEINQNANQISKVELSVDLSTKNAWENGLVTYVNEVPFQNIGKGEQFIVKTKLSLENKKAKNADLILMEEPENHLTYAKLNQLLSDIKLKCLDKQIIVTTHSSFVANKLGLDNIILLNDKKTIRFNDLENTTKNFFEKIAGYDTLRFILCKKAILVEGPSDELIVQKAYRCKNNKLPIEDEIDVISVGTSFLRFLEIAEKLNKAVIVVTDNDGNIKGITIKYNKYLENEGNNYDFIKICFDDAIDIGNEENFNYNTLEPKLVKVNGLELINKILKTDYDDLDSLNNYMKNNKTECALKIFETTENIHYPKYILDAIK
ncbi:MAG: AAA family ATPase [bacterium]